MEIRWLATIATEQHDAGSERSTLDALRVQPRERRRTGHCTELEFQHRKIAFRLLDTSRTRSSLSEIWRETAAGSSARMRPA